jgi:hypothetical protein
MMAEAMEACRLQDHQAAASKRRTAREGCEVAARNLAKPSVYLARRQSSLIASCVRKNAAVASVQTADQIASTLERLHRKRIALLQVLGINALKSLTPPLDALIGEVIEGSAVADRILTLHTSGHVVTLDLQRTGKVVWLASSEPFRPAAGPMPTVRLITEDGTVDLTEPTKTKRITVVVEERAK